jgi:L-alanine-DL-glutamate epimerase-like enolase superfamily enzyme
MRITAVETIVPDLTLSRPFTFVRVHTDEGIVGLGQTADLRTVDVMKWSPFDEYAVESHGQYITPAQVTAVVATIDKAALGGRMEIMIDAHGLWSPGCAMQIVRALDGFPVRWLEDPISSDNAPEWARLRERGTVPIAGGERLLTRYQLRRLLEVGGLDVLISDVTWSGGITETRRTADLADVYGVPLATHGNSGPASLWAAAHVLNSVRNACAAETVRAHHDYYDSVVDGPSILDSGRLNVPTAPGLGIRLREDFPVLERRKSTS